MVNPPALLTLSPPPDGTNDNTNFTAIATAHAPPTGSTSPLVATALYRESYVDPPSNSKRDAIDHATPGEGCESPAKKALRRAVSFVASRLTRTTLEFAPIIHGTSPSTIIPPITPATDSSNSDTTTVVSPLPPPSSNPTSAAVRRKRTPPSRESTNRLYCMTNSFHELCKI